MFSLAYKNVEKNKWKHGDTLHGRNNVDISTREIKSKKVRGNNVGFSTSEITSKKVRGNNMSNCINKSRWRQNRFFDQRNYVEKKKCGNDVDFSISELHRKKYVEMSWKFVEICSSTYRRNIGVESTRIQRGVPVGITLPKKLWDCIIKTAKALEAEPKNWGCL